MFKDRISRSSVVWLPAVNVSVRNTPLCTLNALVLPNNGTHRDGEIDLVVHMIGDQVPRRNDRIVGSRKAGGRGDEGRIGFRIGLLQVDVEHVFQGTQEFAGGEMRDFL